MARSMKKPATKKRPAKAKKPAAKKAAGAKTAGAKTAAVKKPAAKKRAATAKTTATKPAKLPPWIADLSARLALAQRLVTITDRDPTPYTPRDPVAAKVLAAFEATHGITLPQDHRDVLAHLGIGIGPDSGLLRLAPLSTSSLPSVTVTITGADGAITASAGTGPRPTFARAASLARPFPLDRAWSVDEPLPLAPDVHVLDGCLEIADLGCGYRLLLVVTGPRANLVWEDTTAAYAGGGLRPIAPFRTWLDGWLDEALAWLAADVARGPNAKASKGALAAALPRIASVCESAPHLLACLAHVQLALGDRAAALAIVPRVPPVEAAVLRTRLYATEIASASGAKPAAALATHAAREVRLALAANPATPARVIEVLARDADTEVRSRAARHAHAAPALLAQVARDGLAAIALGELGVDSASVIELVVRSANATTALVEEVAAAALASTDRVCAVVLRGVALSPRCPPAVRSQLARSLFPEVRHAVAACRDASEADVRLLARDPIVAVRTAIASRRDAPLDVLLELARDRDSHLRHVLAANPRTPPLALVELCRTEDALYGLGKNPALPPPIQVAFALLADGDEQEHEPDEADVPEVRAWADELDVDERPATLAAADAMLSLAPRHWSYPVVALAERVDDHMGAYTLAGRPWLTDALVERCARDGYAYARAKIAEREDVDPRLLARLARDPNKLVRQAAAANPRLALHELLAMIADANELVREGAAQHAALPVEHRARLIGDENAYTRRGVARSPNVTVGELTRLASDPSEDVRRWVPRARAVTPALLARLAADADRQTAGRAKFRLAIEAYAATLATA